MKTNLPCGKQTTFATFTPFTLVFTLAALLLVTAPAQACGSYLNEIDLKDLAERAVSVHLKDHLPPEQGAAVALGDGVMPLPAILAALQALPQRLIYCFEFRGGGDPEGAIRRSLAYLNKP